MSKRSLGMIHFLLFSLMLGGFLFFFNIPGTTADSKNKNVVVNYDTIEKEVKELMDEGDIPGLSLVVVDGDKPVYFKGFGYADLEKELPVTEDTLFEIGSCSKAFTALAAMQLEERGLISLNDNLSKYFPDFKATYEGNSYEITLLQLLHHTSGIPTSAIALLDISDDDNALKQTVKNVSGIELNDVPGKKFQYSTVNYDIIGAIIEQVSKQSFENYMVENIFKPLDMKDALVGVDQASPPSNMAIGYKVGFFTPRPFTAPVYRGNNPAGYVVLNSKDMTRWLKAQMGVNETILTPLIKKTHQPDLTVKPSASSLTSYAMGWLVNPYGLGNVNHGGLNPNFTAFIIFNEKDQKGVALMANVNGSNVSYIANKVFNRLYDVEMYGDPPPPNALDKSSTVITCIAGLIFLIMLVFFTIIIVDIFRGKRKFAGFSIKQLIRNLAVGLIYIPFLAALYLLPKAMADATWEMAMVWSPTSFQFAVYMIVGSLALSYVVYLASNLFPHENNYVRILPGMILLSLITGGANAVIIFLITGSIYVKHNVEYIVYYFCLALLLYIAGRKVVQTRLLQMTLNIVFDLRMKLIGKIFYTSYQRFERIEDGRVLATLSTDTAQIASSAALFVTLLSSFITTIGVFIYLSTIAFWATMVTIGIILAVALLYYFVGKQAESYLEEARETQNAYLGLLNGMVDGFKELSMHIKKKFHYKDDLENTCDEFRGKSFIAHVKLLHAFLVGESLLVVILGSVGFAVPRLFPAIKDITLMSFIIALLYLIGPINGILGSIPGILQIKVAWGRVKGFIDDVPANMSNEDVSKPLLVQKEEVTKLEAKGIYFRYKSEEEEAELQQDAPALTEGDKTDKPALEDANQSEGDSDEKFAVGPLDFDADKGEIIFIVGGNGSGKTTLAKLLTGLYIPDEGTVAINGKEIPNFQLGEYFSAVFGGFHLFKKLYEIEPERIKAVGQELLTMLELEHKVGFEENGELSTIDLSGGQKKRLALLQCYLENSPIYLFDEVAADQDPQFRRFFYRKLLLKMKEEGKIVIAITHDDHYFDLADRVIKMDLGKIDYVGKGETLQVTN